VVTGLGVISPLGLEVDKFWNKKTRHFCRVLCNEQFIVCYIFSIIFVFIFSNSSLLNVTFFEKFSRSASVFMGTR